MRWDEDANIFQQRLLPNRSQCWQYLWQQRCNAKRPLSERLAYAMGSDIRVSTQNANTTDISLNTKYFTMTSQHSIFSLQRVKPGSKKGLISTVAVGHQSANKTWFTGSLPFEYFRILRSFTQSWQLCVGDFCKVQINSDKCSDMTTAAGQIRDLLDDSVHYCAVKTARARFRKSNIRLILIRCTTGERR